MKGSWKERVQAVLSIAPFFITIGVSITFYFFFSPADVIAFTGVENAYVLMFITAMIGGLTTFNMVPYYSVLFILASSGVQPALLGLASALGVMAGDSYSYFMGRQGGSIFPERLKRPFEFVRSSTSAHPWRFTLACFAYGSISPLSNDFLTIPAGIARIPYRQVVVPLALGNVVFNVAFAYLSIYAYSFIASLVS